MILFKKFLSEYQSVRERKISYDFIHMWNLRNRAHEYRGRGGKVRIKQRQRQTIKDS